MPMFDHALQLAERGFFIFPCAPRSKTPAISDNLTRATRDADQIRQWWHENPGYNIALATGSKSGVFVVDVDGPVGKAWLERHTLPDTVSVETVRGPHFYFQMPVGKDIRNSAGVIAEKVDVRGTGGYVLVPPSIHPDGPTYRWGRFKTVAEAPAWLLDQLCGPRENVAGPSAASMAWRNAEPIPNGKRNATLASLAGKLIRAQLDLDTVRQIVLLWNNALCVPPLNDDEATAIVASIIKTHLRNYGRE
jgi:hypothetical protein